MSKKIIEGSIELEKMYLEELPEFLGEIDEVHGSLYAGKNSFTNLKNSPRLIYGYFNVSRSSLKSLEGGPRIVKGSYDVSRNLLTSLVGSPDEVWSSYDCRYNTNLRSLEGCPQEMRRFDASFCDLRNLIGGPTALLADYQNMSYYIVNDNKNLTSLEGAPVRSYGTFSAYGCGLRDLRGAPEYVDYTFNVSENPLESLEGCPKVVNGNFICYPQGSEKDYSLQTFTEEQIRSVCKVSGSVKVRRDPINLNI